MPEQSISIDINADAGAALGAIETTREAFDDLEGFLDDLAEQWADEAWERLAGVFNQTGEAAGGVAGRLSQLGSALGALAKSFAPMLLLDLITNTGKYSAAIDGLMARLTGFKNAEEELQRVEENYQRSLEIGRQMRKSMAEAVEKVRAAQHGMGEEAQAAAAKFDALTAAGKSAGEALAAIGQDVDLSSIRGVEQFAATLQRLAADGKASAEEVRAAWQGVLAGEDLLAFETRAKAAFEGSAGEAEKLAALLDATLHEAVERTGASWDELSGRMRAPMRQAMNDLEMLASHFDELQARGVDAAAALEAGLKRALDMGKSEQELQAVRAQIEALRAQLGEGVAGGLLAQLERQLQDVRRAADDAAEGINSLDEAHRELGLKSAAAIQEMASRSVAAYEQIKAAGQQEGESAEAWAARKAKAAETMLQRMIAANGGMADAAIKARAAQEGVALTIDSTGKAVVGAAQKTATATSSMEQGWQRVGRAASEAGGGLGSYNSELERTIGLERERSQIPPPQSGESGDSGSSGGNRSASVRRSTWQSLYTKALDYGADERLARQLADKQFDSNGRRTGVLTAEMRRGRYDFFSDEEAVRRAVEQALRNNSKVVTRPSERGEEKRQEQQERQTQPRQQQASGQPQQGRAVQYVSNITLPSGQRQQIRTADAASQSALAAMLQELAAAQKRAM